MTKDERLYLNDLSKKLYGKTSHWQKMLKGDKKPMEEILEDGTSRVYTGLHYSTIEEVKKIMEDLSKEEDELKAKNELEAEALKQAAEIKEKAGQPGHFVLDNESFDKLAEELKEEKHDPVIDVLETVGD